jgi:hypothetical protein
MAPFTTTESVLTTAPAIPATPPSRTFAGKTFDAVGSSLPSEQFKLGDLMGRVIEHLGKADYVVIDTRKLNADQVKSVVSNVGMLSRESQKRIIVIVEKKLKDEIR